MAGGFDRAAVGVRRPLVVVFSATFFVRFAFGITIVVFASYILQKSVGLSGGDVGTVGLVSAMAPVGEFSTVLISGAVADRFGRFPVLFAGMGAAALLFVGVASTRAPIALGALNFLFGIASGAILAASLAIVADESGRDERGYEMGRFDAMNLFGWVAGAAFGLGSLDLLSNGSLGLLFLLGAAILAGGLGFATLLLRGLPVYRGATTYVFSDVVRHVFRRSVLLVTLPWLVIYMLIGTALTFLGDAAKGTGLSTTYLALAIGGGGTLLVVTQPFFGRLADRTGRMRMMTVGATGFILVMLFASLILAYGPQPPLLVALGASVLAALAYGPAALAALADLSAVLSRATTMAIYSLTISLGMVLGLVGSTQLYAALGAEGIYAFFAVVAIGLVALTAARYHDLAVAGRAGATTPAR